MSQTEFAVKVQWSYIVDMYFGPLADIDYRLQLERGRSLFNRPLGANLTGARHRRQWGKALSGKHSPVSAFLRRPD